MGDKFKKVNSYLLKVHKKSKKDGKELDVDAMKKELMKIVKKSPGDIEYCRELDYIIYQEVMNG